MSNGSFSYSRAARLCGRGAFQEVLRAGKKTRRSGFDCYILPNSGSVARLGVSVSKKFFPRAVDRNKLKRLIRESYRHHALLLPPVDVVIRISSARVLEALAELNQNLRSTWDSTLNTASPPHYRPS